MHASSEVQALPAVGDFRIFRNFRYPFSIGVWSAPQK